MSPTGSDWQQPWWFSSKYRVRREFVTYTDCFFFKYSFHIFLICALQWLGEDWTRLRRSLHNRHAPLPCLLCVKQRDVESGLRKKCICLEVRKDTFFYRWKPIGARPLSAKRRETKLLGQVLSRWKGHTLRTACCHPCRNDVTCSDGDVMEMSWWTHCRKDVVT